MKFDLKNASEKLMFWKKDKKNDAEQNQSDEHDESASADSSTGFFGRVSDYFNPEPQKERVLSQEDFNRAGDTYYASISAFYKVIERLLWMVLAVFLAFSIITNYQEITFNNFFYLMKDFSTASDSDVPDYQVLSYDSDSRQTFALYRGGLVSASPSAVSIFTAGGRRTLKSNTEYYSPNIVCCDKYVLVYDSSGSAFSVYNSFSKVYNEQLTSPITDACFGSDGSFAVSTKNNDGKSIVYLYGKNLKRRGEISESNYLFDIAMENGGDRFCTLSYSAGSGNGVSTLDVYNIANSRSAEKLDTIDIDGEFPIGCAFLDNGRMAVLTNQSVRIFNKNYKQVSKYTFYGANIRAFEVGPNGISIVVGAQSIKNAVVFDNKGELVYNKPIEENVSALKMSEKHVFMKTAEGVIRLSINNGEQEYLHADGDKMLVYNEDTALVCGDARAEYLVFGKKR